MEREKRSITINVGLALLIPLLILAVGAFLVLFGKRLIGWSVIVIAIIVAGILNSQRFKKFQRKMTAYTSIKRTYPNRGRVDARYVEVVHWPIVDQAFLKRRYIISGLIIIQDEETKKKAKTPFQIEVSDEEWALFPEKTQVRLSAIERRKKDGELIDREWVKIRVAPPRPKEKAEEAKAEAKNETANQVGGDPNNS